MVSDDLVMASDDSKTIFKFLALFATEILTIYSKNMKLFESTKTNTKVCLVLSKMARFVSWARMFWRDTKKALMHFETLKIVVKLMNCSCYVKNSKLEFSTVFKFLNEIEE
jgi:hypothetical protein